MAAILQLFGPLKSNSAPQIRFVLVLWTKFKRCRSKFQMYEIPCMGIHNNNTITKIIIVLKVQIWIDIYVSIVHLLCAVGARVYQFGA